MSQPKSKIEWTDATFLPVPGCPGVTVTSSGQIAGPSGKILKPYVAPSGHLHVLVRRKKIRVHHAVLEAFIGPRPAGMQCRHLNDEPTDNRVENLAWGTATENQADRRRNGRMPLGERSGTAKLTEADVREIRARHPTETLRALAAEYGVSHTAIRRAFNGTKWGHLT